ncbi:MAG: site-2 protease family protein [Planctomycetota bacterium]|jgi:Zn-dependent protease
MESQLSGWWVADVLATQGPVMLFSWAIWVILSICLHELGHGIAAIKLGDNTPRATGHMTIDPLTHMGGFSLIMFSLVGIAWGAMPVNPHNFRHKYGDAIVSFAGPAVNILLALFCIVAAGIWVGYLEDNASESLAMGVRTVFLTGAMLNIVLLLLNLMPVPPLDGSRILADFVPSYRRLLEHPNAPMVSMILFVLIFFKAGGTLFGVAMDATWWGVELIAGTQ